MRNLTFCPAYAEFSKWLFLFFSQSFFFFINWFCWKIPSDFSHVCHNSSIGSTLYLYRRLTIAKGKTAGRFHGCWGESEKDFFSAFNEAFGSFFDRAKSLFWKRLLWPYIKLMQTTRLKSPEKGAEFFMKSMWSPFSC